MYPAVYIIIWSNEMAVTIIFHKTIFGLFLVAVTITAGKNIFDASLYNENLMLSAIKHCQM